jgi:hypothetical protein
MDFQKMVRQFRENVIDENEPQLINEMASEEYREAAEEKVESLKSGVDYLAWGQLFPEAAEGTNNPAPDGRATRMILDFVPDQMKMAMQIGKKLTKLGWIPSFDEKEVTQKRTVRNAQGEEERVETKEKVAQLKYHKKIKKVIPKGPRAGEEIEKVIQTKLGQLIQKHGTPEEKEFWTAEQIRFRDLDTANEYFFKPHARRYQDKPGTSAVMITRHPIDVLRLSDFSGMKYSCWSEGGAYGHCSQDEALEGGPVAFLVPKEEIEKVSLQDLHGMEEVFSDTDIGSEGKTTAEPSSRLRLISLKTFEADELAVPAQKVYGIDVPGFRSIVSDFVWNAQKDIIVRDGSAKDFVEELDAGDWLRTGGKYSDQELAHGTIGELIANMIPEGEATAEDLGEIAATNIRHDTSTASGVEAQIDQAQDRLDQMMHEWNNDLDNASVHLDAEQYDEDDFYINTTADTSFYIPAPTDEQMEEHDLYMIPEPSRHRDFESRDETAPQDLKSSVQGYWDAKRSFKQTFDDAIEKTENIEIYEYDDLEVESADMVGISQFDNHYQVRIQLRSADIMNHGIEGVDEVEYWLENVVQMWDEHNDELRKNFLVALQADGYLPVAKGFAGAKADIGKEGVPNTFKNFEVEMMDNDKPSEGIVIGTKEQGRTNFALGVYETVDKETGAEIPFLAVINGKARIHDEDPDLVLTQGNVRQRLYKALVAELQKLEDEAEEYAKKQLSLPLEPREPQGELDLGSEYERKDKLSYEREPQRVPEFDFINSEFGFSFDVVEKMENKVLIGIHMDFEVHVDATEENYDAIKAFVTYLDANKPRLVEALQNLIDPYYEAVRASSINMQKQEHEKVKQKVADAEAAGRDPLATGAYASGLREAEERTSSQLYQVVLVLTVEKPIRDIKGKLNDIRAIEGVTVVSHETDDDVIHVGDIVAKVKFRTDRESTRAISYVYKTLVPSINNSLKVPGVKVFRVVQGTMKEIT